MIVPCALTCCHKLLAKLLCSTIVAIGAAVAFFSLATAFIALALAFTPTAQGVLGRLAILLLVVAGIGGQHRSRIPSGYTASIIWHEVAGLSPPKLLIDLYGNVR